MVTCHQEDREDLRLAKSLCLLVVVVVVVEVIIVAVVIAIIVVIVVVRRITIRIILIIITITLILVVAVVVIVINRLLHRDVGRERRARCQGDRHWRGRAVVVFVCTKYAQSPY